MACDPSLITYTDKLCINGILHTQAQLTISTMTPSFLPLSPTDCLKFKIQFISELNIILELTDSRI